MAQQLIRRAAVAGSWYPADATALSREVDAYLSRVPRQQFDEVEALVSPHAGLIFSGPVAAHAYALLRGRTFEAVVLVGPSHFVGFEGVAVYPGGAFDTPLGEMPIESELARSLISASSVIHDNQRAHGREHSLEMQLPFLKTVQPDCRIVPLLMGYQTRETIEALGRALATILRGRRVLIVASSDLSHYFDAKRAEALDGSTADLIARFDAAGLMAHLEDYPESERGRFVACGAGPIVSVMHAARALGATRAAVLKYAHSGDVSGDRDAVVGYLAAAFGRSGDAGPIAS